MAAAQGPQATIALQALLDSMRRSYRMGLALKALAVPLLLWLSWRLGQPRVRERFRRRR
jgi:hypothetical protein